GNHGANRPPLGRPHFRPEGVPANHPERARAGESSLLESAGGAARYRKRRARTEWQWQGSSPLFGHGSAGSGDGGSRIRRQDACPDRQHRGRDQTNSRPRTQNKSPPGEGPLTLAAEFVEDRG